MKFLRSLSRTALATAARREAHSAPAAVSYAHGATTTPLLFETIGKRFRSAVELAPDREMYIFDHQGVRKTYADAYADARRLACALLELGVHQGDRVGIWGPNYYEWVTCQMATAIGGFVQVNINPAYQPEELKFALEKVGVKVLITPRLHRKNNFYRTLREVVPPITAAKEGAGHIRYRALPDLQHIVLFGEQEKKRGCWRYEELLAGVGSNGEARLRECEDRVRPDDPVNIQYTSGTTGYPKAATLTHHSLLNNAFFLGRRAKYDHGHHIICIPNPLYHCFGSMMGVLAALAHTQTSVFPDAGFNAPKTLEAVSKEKCTSLYGTPTMFIDFLAQLEEGKNKNLDISSLRGGLMTGAPCPEALCLRIVRELGMGDLLICYGSTEISPVAATSSVNMPATKRFRHSGYTLDHVETTIVDEDGVAVPRGKKGELLVRGYSVMRGYYNDYERTKKELTEDRWYHTGDTAVMNDDSSIALVGRNKDMIIRGGENIYPTEIEQFLIKLPGIADAYVIGVPDERLGEAVCVWIRLRDGAENITPESIQEACKDKIAHFKIPKYVLIKKESEFPLTVTGKVKKYEMRLISKKELGLEQVRSHFNEADDEEEEDSDK